MGLPHLVLSSITCHPSFPGFLPAGITVSGLGVRDLLLVGNEKYKFFKGVRTSMKSGRITVRT